MKLNINAPHRFIVILLASVFATCSLKVAGQGEVKVYEHVEDIPTYLSGPPEPNPMFFFGRGTQGAEQRIYPYPLFDNLTHEKKPKAYNLVYLENDFVKIGIAPALGGRIFSAVDKSNNYDFIYRQHVIKPALIGLTGAWISGGVEWNIPHHHRASTFSPVQYNIETHADGSKTVWVGELEIRHRMRWSVGYTLRPGSSIVECEIRMSNRTPIENTMLCFANIAVSVNEQYQVIFPPRTQWSTGHAKRDFNPWPVVDGVDVSWYKNNKQPNSWFAVNDEDDFVAGFDHGKNAGIMAVANHHVVTGKKFFTWGTGNKWDKILTDDDGPYLEIMVGAYSDNQPDYSWLQPQEERAFVINLFPFQGIGGVKNANIDAAVNLDVRDGKITYGFYTTHAFNDAVITLKAGDKIIAEEKVAISPARPYRKEVALPNGVKESDIRASITAGGRELVAYSPIVNKPTPKPKTYKEPGRPDKIENTEELFLAGQRIDQFHHPSLDAEPFWNEVLRRDSGNVSANIGLGIVYLRKAKYAQAERYFNAAISRLTDQYTSPKNVEPLYYLGITQKRDGRLKEATDNLYKATWKQEWKAPAFFALAEIISAQGNYPEALELVNHSLDANARNVRAYILKSALLRQLNRTDEAGKVVAFAKEKCDPLDLQLLAEQMLISNGKDDVEFFKVLSDHQFNAEDIAAGYLSAGLWNDGAKVLSFLVGKTSDQKTLSPLTFYYLGYFTEKLGNQAKANAYYAQAMKQPLDYVFPYAYETIPVLRRAIEVNPKDARAPYYLGNLLYDWQPDQAISLWEQSAMLDKNAPITWRNLGIAYAHQNEPGAKQKAIISLEQAVSLPDPYPTHFAELDQLYRAAGVPVDKRLALLKKNQKVVMKKDEPLGYLINLKIFTGDTGDAIALMKNRTFSIWEGGGAFNTGNAWANAHFVEGMKQLKQKKYRDALIDFESALKSPDNLRAEGAIRLQYQIKYWTGCAFEALGEKSKAIQVWNELIASEKNLHTRFSARQQAQRFWITLARKKIDPDFNAEAFFKELSDSGSKTAVRPEGDRDYQFIRENSMTALDEKAFPHYLAGLGFLGLGQTTQARTEFTQALKESPDFLEARIELNQMR